MWLPPFVCVAGAPSTSLTSRSLWRARAKSEQSQNLQTDPGRGRRWTRGAKNPSSQPVCPFLKEPILPFLKVKPIFFGTLFYGIFY